MSMLILGGIADAVAVPQYRLEKIRVPVALIHGSNDCLSDVSWVRQQLRESEAWEIPLYGHIDPLISRDVPKTVRIAMSSRKNTWRIFSVSPRDSYTTRPISHRS